MSEFESELAALKTEVKYLKWIIPAGCAFVALLILVFWNIERNRIGERVRAALDEEGVKTAIVDTKKARDEAIVYNNEIKDLKNQLPWLEISILSIDHSQGVTGKFFNFDYTEIDNTIGNTNWHKKQFLVINTGTSKIAPAFLWRSANGGSKGNGHGRWVSGAAPNQWKTGDSFIIVYAPN